MEFLSSRVGEKVTWRTRAREIPPPALPTAWQGSFFTISADNLLADGDNDGELAAWILRQMAGGYDLAEVLRAPCFAIGPRLCHSQSGTVVDHRA